MVSYVHTMRSEIEKIRHMSLSWRSSYYVAPFESYFLVTGFPWSQSYTLSRRHAKGRAPRVEIWETYRALAPLMDITVRILISGFLHSFSSRGEFPVTPVWDLRPWHMRLKRESGRIPSTRARESRESGINVIKKKKKKKVEGICETSYRVGFSVLPNTNAKNLNTCGTLCALPCTPTRRR